MDTGLRWESEQIIIPLIVMFGLDGVAINVCPDPPFLSLVPDAELECARDNIRYVDLRIDRRVVDNVAD